VGEVGRHAHRCDPARAWISRALDGELSEFEQALLSAHLASCPACRRFQNDLAAIAAQLRATPLEELRRPVALPERRRVPLRALEAAAAALAVAAVGLGSLLGAVHSRETIAARSSSSKVVSIERQNREQRNFQFTQQLLRSENMGPARVRSPLGGPQLP
jgi:predicted anti-sigma-YlaC factor YlaD